MQAAILNDKFVSCFTKEDMSSLPSPELKFDPNHGLPLSNINVDVETVNTKLEALKTDKACGPDKIRARTLKELSAELSLPLSMIFNKCLAEGVVPNDWKLSNVTAIFKKGDLWGVIMKNKSLGTYSGDLLVGFVCSWRGQSSCRTAPPNNRDRRMRQGCYLPLLGV